MSDTVENSSEEIVLSEEQKLKILEFWNSHPKNPPALKAIVELVFPGKESRDKWGRSVRKFLATRKLKPLLAQDYVKKEKIILTEEQKEFIVSNSELKKPYELGMELFGPETQPASNEVRAISEVLASIPGNALFHKVTGLKNCTEEYIPPKTLLKIVPKVNEYANPDKKLDSENLTSKQKKEMFSLIGYIHTKRFLFHITTFEKEQDRILFESSFIKWTYDKGDLTQEDIDQYIMLAIDVVSSHSILRTINMMQKEQDTLIENGEKMSMTLVEAINVSRKEYNDSSKRQNELFKALTQKRSERLNKLVKENATILNLVSFVKDEESRLKLITYNQLKSKKLKEEVYKYIDMSHLKIKILGIGPEEIING